MRAPGLSMLSTSCPLRWFLARVMAASVMSVSRSVSRVEDHAHGLLDRLLPRAEVHGRQAGVGVQRGVRVDGVGQPTLLAHLLEEVRAPGAAEDRVDDEDRVAVRVAALGPGPAEAHVILFGVLLREAREVAGVRAR